MEVGVIEQSDIGDYFWEVARKSNQLSHYFLYWVLGGFRIFICLILGFVYLQEKAVILS